MREYEKSLKEEMRQMVGGNGNENARMRSVSLRGFDKDGHT